MTERRQITAPDVSDAFFEGLLAIWRWLIQVAAIAIGTCLGIVLFVMVARDYIGNRLDEVDFGHFDAPTTSTQPSPSFVWGS